MGIETALIIAAVAAAGAATYSASEQNSAQKTAKSQAQAAQDAARAEGAKVDAELAKRESAEAAEIARKDDLKRRAKRSSTLLTSSQGVAGEAPVARKTLLGE